MNRAIRYFGAFLTVVSLICGVGVVFVVGSLATVYPWLAFLILTSCFCFVAGLTVQDWADEKEREVNRLEDDKLILIERLQTTFDGSTSKLTNYDRETILRAIEFIRGAGKK